MFISTSPKASCPPWNFVEAPLDLHPVPIAVRHDIVVPCSLHLRWILQSLDVLRRQLAPPQLHHRGARGLQRGVAPRRGGDTLRKLRVRARLRRLDVQRALDRLRVHQLLRLLHYVLGLHWHLGKRRSADEAWRPRGSPVGYWDLLPRCINRLLHGPLAHALRYAPPNSVEHDLEVQPAGVSLLILEWQLDYITLSEPGTGCPGMPFLTSAKLRQALPTKSSSFWKFSLS